MTGFATKRLPAAPDTVAPDGSDVRLLLSLPRGGFAHFRLAPGQTSVPVAHNTVEEIWFFVEGRGQMWRRVREQEEIVEVEAGVCVTLPVGAHFQFRAVGSEALAAVAVTMPPWPGRGEAYFVEGPWTPTLPAGPA
jgi:mannose-6-phosphate isomerase-like protein (cupin superfamily)